MLQPEPPPGSALRGCPSLGRRARTRAGRRAEKRRKTCRRGFASPPEPPFREPEPPAAASPSLGESSFGSDCSPASGGGTRVGGGAGSVVNPAERLAGARKAPGWRRRCGGRACEARRRVVSPPRGGGFASGVRAASVCGKLRRETRGPPERRIALPAVRPPSPRLPRVKSQRN